MKPERPRPTLSAQPAGATDGNGKDAAPAKPRLFLAATLKQLFRNAVKAVTSDAPGPKPATRRKRGGDETRGAFSLAARKIVTRAVRLPQEAYRTATAYLWDTLEWLNQWQASQNDLEDDFHDAPRDHLYPRL